MDFNSEAKEALLRLYEDAWCAHIQIADAGIKYKYIIWSTRKAGKKCLYTTYTNEEYAWEQAYERLNRNIIKLYENGI